MEQEQNMNTIIIEIIIREAIMFCVLWITEGHPIILSKPIILCGATEVLLVMEVRDMVMQSVRMAAQIKLQTMNAGGKNHGPNLIRTEQKHSIITKLINIHIISIAGNLGLNGAIRKLMEQIIDKLEHKRYIDIRVIIFSLKIQREKAGLQMVSLIPHLQASR